MAAALLFLPANRAFNSNGLAVPGATVDLYLSGTLTPANFYANSALSVSLGSTITANGAGRFAPAYQDESVAFRLVTRDSTGVQLDDIDPYYFGTITGATVTVTGNTVADRAALAVVSSPAAGNALTLVEAGREGVFVFDDSDLSDEVAADSDQLNYVAPASDPTGTSGAWVRKVDPTVLEKFRTTDAKTERGVQPLKQDNGPILIVASGQSNMIGSNNETSGTVETDAGVLIWNEDTNAWQVSEPGVPAGPFTYNTTGAGFPNPNNIAHNFCLRLRQETGRLVYLVLDARGSTSITEWTDGWTIRDMFGSLSGKVANALSTPELSGVTKASAVLWAQGEEDKDMPADDYRAYFYEVYARFTAASWFDAYRPFICSELPIGSFADDQNVLHSSHYRRGFFNILTAKADGLEIDSSNVHFTGASLQELGYNRFWQSYVTYLNNPPRLNEDDIYIARALPFFALSELQDRPVSALTIADILTSTPDGLRSGISPFSDLEGKLGYRHLVGSALRPRPELITNGTFATDASGWTAGAGAVLSVVSGRLRVTNPAASFSSAYQAIPTVVGRTYRIIGNGYTGTAGSWRIRAGTVPAGSENLSNGGTIDGTTNLTFVATATTTYISLLNFSTVAGTYAEFDDISLQDDGGVTSIPSDTPGGHWRLTGDMELPSVVALGYTLTLTNIASSGPVVITTPGVGTISGRVSGSAGLVSTSTLTLRRPGDSVTLVAYAADGSDWSVINDDRSPMGEAVVAIADDSVVSITPPVNCGKFSISANPNASNPDIQLQGLFGYDIGTTPNIGKWSGGTKAAAVVSDVTGTTGTDGNVTVGVVAGALKVENRSGASINLNYCFLP